MNYFALLLLLGVAGAAAQIATKQTLLEAIKGNKDLSNLAGAIEQAPEIAEALETFEGTVFAPNNEAFAGALNTTAQLGLTVEQVSGLLPEILAYHVAPGTPLFKADLEDQLEISTAAEGKKLTVVFENGEPIIEGVGMDASIVTADIKVGDKVAVHIVDNVLLPFDLSEIPLSEAPAMAPAMAPLSEVAPVNEVRQLEEDSVIVDAAKAEGLDNLVAALEAADLVSALSGFNGTIFAPTNEAFETLLNATGLDLSMLSAEELEAVSGILQYHVVPGFPILAADFANNEVLETLNGDTLTVLVRKKGVIVQDSTGAKVTVVKANIKAGDAVIHVVEGVLMPTMEPTPAPAPTALPASSASTTLASIAALAASFLAASLML